MQQEKKEFWDPETGEPEILNRAFKFAKMFIELYRQLQHDDVGRILGKQVLRSGTSVGANIQEAQAAQTRRDFITKMSIAHKEAMESKFWLRLIREANLAQADLLRKILGETNEMGCIIASIIITAKRGLQETKLRR